MRGRAGIDPGPSGDERRAVKAGRRPPEGFSLEGPVAVVGIMDVEPAGGFVVAAFRRSAGGDACADRLQFPTGCEVDANLKLGCVVMSSSGPDVVGSEHGEIRRSQQCSITY